MTDLRLFPVVYSEVWVSGNYYRQSTTVEVLVTGAAGFIGQNLVRRLLCEDYHVRVLVKPGDTSNWSEEPGVTALEGDVRNFPCLLSAAAGVRHIYHLAALTAPDPSDPSALYEVNVGGTRNLARAALENRVDRLVYTSSAAVYGRRIRKHGINEATAPQPDSPYATSKIHAEQLLRSLGESEGLPFSIVRTSNVFGPGVLDWLEFFQLIQSGNFRLVGRGDGLMHVTSTKDLCEGLFLCANAAVAKGQTYIFSGGEDICLRDWIEWIRAEVGGVLRKPAIPAAPIRVYNLLNSITLSLIGRELPRADRLNLFLGDRSFDISRAREELGYDPQVTARQLVRDTAAWYRSRGWLEQPNE